MKNSIRYESDVSAYWSYSQCLRQPDKVNLIFTESSAYISIRASLSALTIIDTERFGDRLDLRSNEEPTWRTPAEYEVS